MFFSSAKKTLIMNKATKQLQFNLNVGAYLAQHSGPELFTELERLKQDKIRTFESLYACMRSMPGYSHILEEYTISGEEMFNIAERCLMAGYTYQGRDFLPVALISFGPSMTYMFQHKDVLLNRSLDELCDVVEVARTLL